jgi:hypothetical protein
MDLYQCKSKAIILPTPGQLEQEYLANFNNGKNQWVSTSQNELEIKLQQFLNDILI